MSKNTAADKDAVPNKDKVANKDTVADDTAPDKNAVAGREAVAEDPATRTVLVVNGSKADARQASALRDQVARAFAEVGWPKPDLVMTTPQDPGTGVARAAVRDGARMVVACGGDGTVNAVAAALDGTGVTLGVLPLGTGNLLAGHLGVPTGLDDAIAVLTGGHDRHLDLGAVGDRVFVGMAGLGLDAAMIADSSERWKRRLGWLAYVPSIARHLGDRGRRVSVRIDDQRVRHARVKALIVGNFGKLHGGIDLMPQAAPDDGLLDVVVLEPAGRLAGWLAVVIRLLTRRDGREITRYQGRSVQVRTRRPVPLELDGDAYRTANTLAVQIKPEALVVRAPEPLSEPAGDRK